MKKLNPVGIDIKSAPNIDADDMGQRLVDCVSALSTDNEVINLVKIHIGDSVSAYDLEKLLTNAVINPLKEMGAKNCIFVPLKQGFIDDITIDYIKVREDDLNN